MLPTQQQDREAPILIGERYQLVDPRQTLCTCRRLEPPGEPTSLLVRELEYSHRSCPSRNESPMWSLSGLQFLGKLFRPYLVALVGALLAVDKASLVPAASLIGPHVAGKPAFPGRTDPFGQDGLPQPTRQLAEVPMKRWVALRRISSRSGGSGRRPVRFVFTTTDVPYAGRNVAEFGAHGDKYRLSARPTAGSAHNARMPLSSVSSPAIAAGHGLGPRRSGL